MGTNGRHSTIRLKTPAETQAMLDGYVGNLSDAEPLTLDIPEDWSFTPPSGSKWQSRQLMTIRPDGTLELAPDATPREVAESLAQAYSGLHQDQADRIKTLESLLLTCRAVLSGLGLRTHCRAFWAKLDAALGLAPTTITRLDPEDEAHSTA